MPPKGKQGTRGQKQIIQENKATITFYTYGILASYVPVIVFQFLRNYSNVNWVDWGLIIFSTLVFALSMKMMNSMASSSLDLNMNEGMGEYLKDVIILTVVCQVFGFLSLYFWLLWLLIPAVALYKLWSTILAPWIFQEAPEPTEKQKKKMERKMARRQ